MTMFQDEVARAVRSGADWEHHRAHRPPHAGPAQDELGQPAMTSLTLARSSDVAVGLRGITAYSDGLLLHVVVLFADEQRRDALDWSLQEYGRSPGRFRFGVTYPDGTLVATGTRDAPPLETSGLSEALILQASSASALRWQGDYWLWPLPAEGEMVVGCQWPDRAVVETLVSIDTAPLLEAARSCGPVWTT
jgi:hypothetical protein